MAIIPRRVAITLAIGWILGPIAAEAQTPEQSQLMAIYRRAEASWAQGKLADAIRDYEQIVAKATEQSRK